MSMIGNLLRVSDTELKEYIDNSTLLEDRLYAENDDESALIDIDKSWEGIFYLLTGCAVADIENAMPPLSWCLFSLQAIDEEQDLGYGPAYYVTTDQVKEVSKELNNISEDMLRSRFDAKKMMALGIYPEIWDKGEEVISYLTEYFESIKDFYNEASKENQAVITFLN